MLRQHRARNQLLDRPHDFRRAVFRFVRWGRQLSGCSDLGFGGQGPVEPGQRNPASHTLGAQQEQEHSRYKQRTEQQCQKKLEPPGTHRKRVIVGKPTV